MSTTGHFLRRNLSHRSSFCGGYFSEIIDKTPPVDNAKVYSTGETCILVNV